MGIDKTIIKNFNIKTIHIDHLQSENMKIRHGKSIELEINPDKHEFRKLEIKDDYFGIFQCGVIYSNDMKKLINYSKLTLLSSSDNNLQNLTVAEYKQRVVDVFEYINKEYQIEVEYNFNSLVLAYIEINFTFMLESKFSDYKRVLLMLMRNAPKEKYTDTKDCNMKYATWYEVNEHTNADTLETILICNSARQLIIYNKSKQLRDTKNIALDKDYIRIEYKLKRKDTIRQTFGSTIEDLTDMKIEDFFVENFSNDIITPFAKYREKTIVISSQLLKYFLFDSDRLWYPNFIRRIREYEAKNSVPILIDIEDIIPVLKSSDTGKNWTKKRKAMYAKASISERDLIGNNKKITEILKKCRDDYKL